MKFDIAVPILSVGLHETFIFYFRLQGYQQMICKNNGKGATPSGAQAY